MPRPKKAPTSGSAYLDRHGLKYLSVPLTEEARELLREAAQAQGEAALGPWAARTLEMAAQGILDESRKKSGMHESNQ